MSTTRQPLLTEEQIQEMLEYAKKQVESTRKIFFKHDIESYSDLWLFDNYGDGRRCHECNTIYCKVFNAGCLPTEVGMDKFLAFLRGKTKRVLNLDRLRKDVKAWVDDPNRKYPEWMMELSSLEERIEFVEAVINAATDEFGLCMYAASTIGINPDDYFEEVEVTE